MRLTLTNKVYLAEAATYQCLAKKSSEVFRKIHRKALVQEPFWRPQAYNFIKTETPAWVTSFEFWEIYQDSFFIAHLWTAGNILKSEGFYRSPLNWNVHQFIFIFVKEYFLAHSVTLCALVRLEDNHWFSRFSLRSQLHRVKETKRNVLDFPVFLNQAHYKKFLRQ